MTPEQLDAFCDRLTSPELNAILREADTEMQTRLDAATRLEALGCDCPALIAKVLGPEYAAA